MPGGQSPPQAIVDKPTQRRTYLACRSCRRLLVLCTVDENPPCRPCEANGRECVIEEYPSGSYSKRGARSSPGKDEQGNKRPRYQELDQQGRQLRHIPGPCQQLAWSGDAVTHSPSLRPPQSFSWFKSRNDHWANDDSQASILSEVAASSQDPTLLDLDAPITAVRYTTLPGQPPSPISLPSEDSRPPTASLRGCSNNLGQVPQPYNKSSKTPRAEEEDNLESRLVNDYNRSITNAISQNYLDWTVNPGLATHGLHRTGEDRVLTSSNAIMEAFTSGYNSPNTETSWISGPSSQCHPNNGSLDVESSDMQSLLQTPDGIIAFNLFAAYIQASMNKPEA
ncbi:hypothetical protein EDB80DRAFT_718123 [Ilyonectria destructans]|nr:hypothetical protein EDB80DRAFT_718123 [Ilyonectria destructans]